MTRPALFLLAVMFVIPNAVPASADEVPGNAARRVQASALSTPLIVGTAASGQLIVAQRHSGNLSLVDLQSGATTSAHIATRISDAVCSADGQRLIVADAVQRELITCQIVADSVHVLSRMALGPSQPAGEPTSPTPVQPMRLAFAESTGLLCISFRWEKRVAFCTIDVAGDMELSPLGTLVLDFCPNCVAALAGDRFLVADAFGGKLAVAKAGAEPLLVARQEVFGHHIGGVCVSEDRARILVSHQVLSRLAHTTQDDIHWGSLMQNVVSLIAVDSLDLTPRQFDRRRRVIPVGDTGGAAADPQSVAFWRDGLAVTSAGADRVWAAPTMNEALIPTPVGTHPASMVCLPGDRVATGNLFDGTITLVDLRTNRVVRTYGTPSRDNTPAARGERAFYSGTLSHDRWMSCSSCHVDGHTTDLLADTLGDGSFGSAKRIPSLFGVSRTPPWGWLGNKMQLEQQLQQTLTSTMHGQQHDETIADLAAFLETLTAPDQSDSDQVQSGRQIFESRGCVRCHARDHLTSAKTYNVGLTDELGHEYFNPPSLRGLRYRSRFGHDGRFHSLDALLQEHPPAATPLSDRARRQLIAFLLSV